MRVKIDVQFSYKRELNNQEITMIEDGIRAVIERIPELIVNSINVEFY